MHLRMYVLYFLISLKSYLKFLIETFPLLKAAINLIQEMSIELSLEDVKKVAFHYGFVMEVYTTVVIDFALFQLFLWYTVLPYLQKEKTIETTYTANPLSMMQVSL